MRDSYVGSEPYEGLGIHLRLTAVIAFRRWARRQRNPFRPFSEVIDGTRFTPFDLLIEPPPLIGTREIEYFNREFGLAAILRDRPPVPMRIARAPLAMSRTRQVRVWPHVLNLVAVQAEHGADDVYELLGALSQRREEAGGSVATSDA